MPLTRKTGIIDKDPQKILQASTLMLYASGLTANTVAKKLHVPREEISSILDPVRKQCVDGLVRLARTCAPCLGPADKQPDEVGADLRLRGVGSAKAIGYTHGLIAGPIKEAQPTQHYLIELRRLSGAPGQPIDWIILAGWAFLTSDDREWATKFWTRARGLPTSAEKRHWGGINRPLQIVQFASLQS